MDRLSNKDFRDQGYLSEINRVCLHPLGLTLAFDPETNELFVLDGRDDPEGIVFGDECMDDVTKKSKLVTSEYSKRAIVRFRGLGFIIQPTKEMK